MSDDLDPAARVYRDALMEVTMQLGRVLREARPPYLVFRQRLRETFVRAARCLDLIVAEPPRVGLEAWAHFTYGPGRRQDVALAALQAAIQFCDEAGVSRRDAAAQFNAHADSTPMPSAPAEGGRA